MRRLSRNRGPDSAWPWTMTRNVTKGMDSEGYIVPSKISSVAFVGLGIMGSHMARHLLEAGYSLHVSTKTPGKAEPLLARGAVWHDNAADAAAVAEAVITMVGSPTDIESLYFGANGILNSAAAGTVLIDMTTSSPTLAIRIHQSAAEKGLLSLDAPVSGGEAGARDATLTIMAGGEEATFRLVEPLFRRLGSKITLAGAAGAGQSTKLCNQIVMAGAIAGVAEGLTYAKRAGLDLAQTLQTLSSGAARSFQLEMLGPRMLANDFAPGFMVQHILKDLSIAAIEAAEHRLDLKMLNVVREQFAVLADNGGARDGMQAIFRCYDTPVP